MSEAAASWRAGAARCEIRLDAQGVGMMGYGRADQRVRGHATPLYSRAFGYAPADAADGAALYFAQAEICMIFPEIKRAVLAALARRHGEGLFRDDNVMLTAQHTHSAPGGFSHFPFYNFSIPGFRPRIFDAVVGSLAQALSQARERLEPAELRFTHGDFPADVPVAFNRSLAAYNRNPGVHRLTDEQTHLGIERRMWLLHAGAPGGRCIGLVNWFGVHPTSLGNRNRLVSYDNKGYAAEEAERALGAGAVAIFAQQFAGDVSPNAQGAMRRRWRRGPHADEHDNARFNGHLQATQALTLVRALDDTHRLRDAGADAAIVHRELSDIECDPDFTGGLRGERTSAPCHGVSFFGGSPVDGPGAPRGALIALGVLARIARWRMRRRARVEGVAAVAQLESLLRSQAPKRIVLQAGSGSFAGLRDLRGLPARLDPILAEVARQHRAGALDDKPWVPTVLPLQYLRIGELALIGFPGEITTEAGRQLRSLCAEVLAPTGVGHVLICSYANAYFGYCTTHAEYQQQQYEGGHTTFGNRTHDGFRTEYRKLLRECAKPQAERRLRDDPPQCFSQHCLSARTVES